MIKLTSLHHKEGKGYSWHYFSKKYGLSSPEKKSKFDIPQEIQDNYLPEYHKIAAIHRYDGGFFPGSTIAICAIPKKGGPYGIIRYHASLDDVGKMTSKRGLLSLLRPLMKGQSLDEKVS